MYGLASVVNQSIKGLATLPDLAETGTSISREKSMKSALKAFLGTAMAVFLVGSPVSAADVQVKNFKVIGGWSSTSYTQMFERPFWEKDLPAATGGKISADFSSLDTLGLKGTETLRLLKLGVADFASAPVSFVAGDFKLYDGLDLAGVILDYETIKASVDAYRPVIDDNMQKNFGSKLMMVWPSPPQVLYCRAPVNKLADLVGKKVRTFNQTLSDFIEAAGGTAVTLSFAEVVPALERGTVDCAITGTGPGNHAKWYEVTDYLYPLVLGWAPYFNAVNLKTWNSIDDKTQSYLLEQFSKLEAELWEHANELAQDGINCNIGQGECKYGTKGGMKLIAVTEGDKAKVKKMANDVIIQRWADRCGAACVKAWNDTVGKIVGLTAKTK